MPHAKCLRKFWTFFVIFCLLCASNQFSEFIWAMAAFEWVYCGTFHCSDPKIALAECFIEVIEIYVCLQCWMCNTFHLIGMIIIMCMFMQMKLHIWSPRMFRNFQLYIHASMTINFIYFIEEINDNSSQMWNNKKVQD